MRHLVFMTALMAGCGGAESTAPAAEPSSPPKAPTVSDKAVAATSLIEEELTAAPWENASCGERQYLRRLTFSADGTFSARDEVAPCPEGAQCVSSGVIEWSGTWVSREGFFRLAPDMGTGRRLPDIVPETFVILREDPLSIGEQIDGRVCPYRQKP